MNIISLLPFRSLQALTLAVFILFLAGCGGSGSQAGSGTNPGATATVSLDTLSGIVRGAGSGGSFALENVTVSVASSQGQVSALTDANGSFIIPSVGVLPVGMVRVSVDGSTAQAPGFFAFPKLDVTVPLSAGTTDLVLPQVVVLPDLNNSRSANQNLALNAGFAATPINVIQSGGLIDLQMSGPVGTALVSPSLTGLEPSIDLNLTPVVPSEVPMPLPDGIHAAEFISIQPEDVRFGVPGAAVGLDIVLPNTQGLDIGTVVDIWSFDPQINSWINNSVLTGNRGVVSILSGGGVPLSGFSLGIVAKNVILRGGWVAAVLPVNLNCGTRIAGSVIDTNGVGIANVAVSVNTGQFTSTNSNGDFVLTTVPAYDAAFLLSSGLCSPQSAQVSFALPPSVAAPSAMSFNIPANDIVTGGTTLVAPVTVTTGSNGSVAGVVVGPHTNGEMITLSSPGFTSILVTPNARDSFFATGLAAGDWTASIQFTNDPQPTVVNFTVVAGQVTTISLQNVSGVGNGDIAVLVMINADDNLFSDLVPLSGAQVHLQGTDASSASGLVMITDGNGRAVFQNVSGPFTVTAQKDLNFAGTIVRFASSLVDFTPLNNTIGIPFFSATSFEALVPDATLSGVIGSLPPQQPNQFLEVRVLESGSNFDAFDETTTVSLTSSGSFSLPVPSGIDFDMSIALLDTTGGGTTPQTLATLTLPSVGQAPQAGSLIVNADFAGASPWDRAVSVNVSGLSPGDQARAQFELNDQAGTAFRFDLADLQNGSTVLMLPDLSDSAFAGFKGSLSGDNEFPSLSNGQQNCEVFFNSTPSSLALEFLSAPNLTAPQNNDILSLAQIESFQVAFDENGSGTLGTNGLNFFSIFSSALTAPTGVNAVAWSFLLPGGVTDFTIPPTALPMFVANSAALFIPGKFRLAGHTLDHTNFFSENLQAEFKALFQNQTVGCQTDQSNTIIIQ